MSVATPPAMAKQDYVTLAGLLAAFLTSRPITRAKDEARIAVSIVHSHSSYSNTLPELVLRAYGASTFFRFCSATVLGELRHFACHGPGRNNDGDFLKVESIIKYKSCTHHSRNKVFKYAFKLPPMVLLELLPIAEEVYYRGNWSGGYGGTKWAGCANATKLVGLAIKDFLHDKDEMSWKMVAESLNIALNTVHNNGGMFNKFLSSEFLDSISSVPSFGLANSIVATMVLCADTMPIHGKPGKVMPKNLKIAAIERYAPRLRPYTRKKRHG